MFLIQYADNHFIDAEKIVGLSMCDNKTIAFWYTTSAACDTSDILYVQKEFKGSFLNHLQALNRNACGNIEVAFKNK